MELNEIVVELRKAIPKEFIIVEDSGMTRFELPLSVYPDTYNKKPLMFASVAQRKAGVTLTLTAVKNNEKAWKWFKNSYSKVDEKLEMKNACLKFGKRPVNLKLISQAIKKVKFKDFIKDYERIVGK